MLRQLTAEQFLDERFDLPDGGQWTELIQGIPICLEPPNLEHGNVVLNLSKALAAYVQGYQRGYACFELGLKLGTQPDTVRFPAVSYFMEGERFAESDKACTEAVPVLVAEIASTPDRRAHRADRAADYRRHGVAAVWVIDPQAELVEVYQSTGDPILLSRGDVLRGDPLLPGFSTPVSSLFTEPAWWGKPRE